MAKWFNSLDTNSNFDDWNVQVWRFENLYCLFFFCRTFWQDFHAVSSLKILVDEEENAQKICENVVDKQKCLCNIWMVPKAKDSDDEESEDEEPIENENEQVKEANEKNEEADQSESDDSTSKKSSVAGKDFEMVDKHEDTDA